MKQHLFLLCGLPFAGKSTMGRALAKTLGVVHVEVDAHHQGGQDGFSGRRVERSEWIAAYQAAYREVEAALELGQSVVFDAVSYRRTQRDRIRRITDKHGVPLVVLHLDVTRDEALRRIEANRRRPVRVNVPNEDFDEVAAGMQPPQDDEATVTYRPDEPVEQWIERTIRPLLEESER